MANVLRNALVLLNFDPRSQQLAPSCGSAATAGEVVDLLLSPQTSTSVSSKLFESVSWFLFSKSDPDRAKQLFHGCWPIVDKQQAREFRSSVLKELERLKREGLLPSFVQIRRSYFEECRGERFEIALLAMSVYTLQMVLAREFGADQNTLRLPTPQEDLEGSMKAFDPEHQEAIFFSSQRDRDGVEVKWIEFARQLQQELLTTEQNDSKTGPSIESSVLKELQTVCQDKLASVEALWCQLEDIDKGLGSSFDIIEAALSNGASPAALEGPIEPIELPSFISKETASHLYDSMGKLDLQALVNLSTEVLNRTKTELDRLGQTEFLNEDTAIQKACSLQMDLVSNIDSLQSHLESKRDDVLSSIRMRQNTRDFKMETTSFKTGDLQFPPKTPKVGLKTRNVRPDFPDTRKAVFPDRTLKEANRTHAPVPSSGFFRTSAFDLRTPARKQRPPAAPPIPTADSSGKASVQNGSTRSSFASRHASQKSKSGSESIAPKSFQSKRDNYENRKPLRSQKVRFDYQYSSSPGDLAELRTKVELPRTPVRPVPHASEVEVGYPREAISPTSPIGGYTNILESDVANLNDEVTPKFMELANASFEISEDVLFSTMAGDKEEEVQSIVPASPPRNMDDILSRQSDEEGPVNEDPYEEGGLPHVRKLSGCFSPPSSPPLLSEKDMAEFDCSGWMDASSLVLAGP